MTDRNVSLQADLATRRVSERRRRATTQRDAETDTSGRWIWWLCGLTAMAAGIASLV